MPKTSVSHQSEFVNFGRSINNFWRGYVDFGGRASRSEFWFGVLFFAIICMPMLVLISILNEMGISEGLWVLDPVLYVIYYTDTWLLLFIPFLLPLFALTVRRFRDAGVPVLVCVIPTLVACFLGLVPMDEDIFAAMFVFLYVPFFALLVMVGCMAGKR